jgi:hypothetical protein
VGIDPPSNATKGNIQIIAEAACLFLAFKIYLCRSLRKHIICAPDI